MTEAVLTVGWGAVRRLDLEPATCGDPDCVADHGYTGALAAEDFALRISSSADGPEAVEAVLQFAAALSCSDRPALSVPVSAPVLPRYDARSLSDILPSAMGALGAPGLDQHPRPAAQHVVRRVPRRRPRLEPPARLPRDCALPLVARPAERPADLRRPVDDRDQHDQSRHRAAAWVSTASSASPRGSPAPTSCSTRCAGMPTSTRSSGRSHETVFGRARASGVDATVVSRRVFEGSGLTVASQRGAEYVGADTPGERISAVVQASSQPSSLVYVYEGELDSTGHRIGCRSWAWEHQLGVVDEFAQRLRAALPPEVTLVVTADHGMVDIATGPTHRRRRRGRAARRCQPARRRGAAPASLLRGRRRRRRGRPLARRSSATRRSC